MKQHITTKQLNELSKKGKERLRVWQRERGLITNSYWYLNRKGFGLPSIGQMIEFLYNKGFKGELNDAINLKAEGLCDALWEACKEILND